MDILNFISWIKRGDYREVLPTDTTNLIAIGSKDPQRGDDYRPMSINAAPLQSVYNTGNVTQTGSLGATVTVNAHNGIITTVVSTLNANSKIPFTVLNNTVTPNSKILVSVEYPLAAGSIPVVTPYDITSGSFKLAVCNAGASSFNSSLKIHFMILE